MFIPTERSELHIYTLWARAKEGSKLYINWNSIIVIIQ